MRDYRRTPMSHDADEDIPDPEQRPVNAMWARDMVQFQQDLITSLRQGTVQKKPTNTLSGIPQTIDDLLRSRYGMARARSKYIGVVSMRTKKAQWLAVDPVQYGGRGNHIGTADDEADAARVVLQHVRQRLCREEDTTKENS